LVNNNGPFAYGVNLSTAAQHTVSDLSVRLTAYRQVGVSLGPGATATRVRVTGSHSLTLEKGFLAGAGADMPSVVVDLGNDLSSEAIDDYGGASISDSTLSAGWGIFPASNGTTARRVTVRATVPFEVFGGTLNVANALVMPHPDNPSSPSFEAA